MAVFHHLFSNIYRGSHTCSTATAAYRSGSKLKLKTSLRSSGNFKEITFDYSTKKGIGFSQILSAQGTPEWIKNREDLWQFVEDDQPDEAILACESTFALPEELSLEENISLVLEYVNKILLTIYQVVDVNIHNEHSNNPHVHLMSPLTIFNPGISISDTAELTRINYQNIKEFKVKLIEDGFIEVVNKHLSLKGYKTFISNKPNAGTRYNQLRPWL